MYWKNNDWKNYKPQKMQKRVLKKNKNNLLRIKMANPRARTFYFYFLQIVKIANLNNGRWGIMHRDYWYFSVYSLKTRWFIVIFCFSRKCTVKIMIGKMYNCKKCKKGYSKKNKNNLLRIKIANPQANQKFFLFFANGKNC